MADDTKDISLGKLVSRFEKAIALLKRKTTMHDIALEIGISAGFLSRYRKPQLYNIQPIAYENIFEVIDRLIFEKFNQQWNKQTTTYELVENKLPLHSPPPTFDNKLLGLNGHWRGISWNKEKTDFSSKYESDTPAEYYNLFYLTIHEQGLVDCYLSKTKMQGTVNRIASKTISIELTSDSRRMVLFAQLSLQDDLGKLRDITFAYADTGDKFVKCGLTIATRLLDDEIIPESEIVRVDELPDDISKIERKYLSGTQLIANEWDFLI